MGKRILITGSSGFIGRNLKEILETSYSVLAPTHTQLDLLDSKKTKLFFESYPVDVVIHAANWNNTKQSASEYEVLSNNLRMFYNLIENQKHFQKMIYFGSGAEYDKSNSLENIREDEFGNSIPKDAYGFSKYIMARETLSSDKIYDLCVFGVYGKYEEWHRRFISNAICRSLLDMPITLSQNAEFDYISIEDLVNIVHWFIIHSSKYHRYNVTTGQSVSLLQLAEMVRKNCGNNSKIIVARDGWKNAYTANNDLLLEELEGYNFSDVENNIVSLIEFYQHHMDEINASKLI